MFNINTQVCVTFVKPAAEITRWILLFAHSPRLCMSGVCVQSVTGAPVF